MKLGSQATVSVGTSSGRFVSPSSKRVAMRISAPPSGHVTISTKSPAVDGDGIVLNQGNPSILLCPECVGNLISNAWFAIASPAAVTLGVIEVMEG